MKPACFATRAVLLLLAIGTPACAATDAIWPPAALSLAQQSAFASEYPDAGSVVVDCWQDLDLRHDPRAAGFVGTIEEYTETWIRAARALEDHARIFTRQDDNCEIAEQRIEILGADGSRRRVAVRDLTWIKFGSRDGDVYYLDGEDAYAVIPGLRTGDRLRVWTRYKVKWLPLLPMMRFGGMSIPCARESMRLRLPADHALQTAVVAPPAWVDRLHHEESVVDGKRAHIWSGRDFAAALEEPFAPQSPANALRLVLRVTATAKTVAADDFSVGATWEAGAAACYRAIAPTMAPDAALTAQAAHLVAGLTTPLAKAAALHRHVQRTCRYLGLYDARGGLIPDPAATVAKRGFGDCKGLAAYLIALLRAAGIPAYPVLVCTGDAGPVVSSCPSLAQFNHVIVWADTGDDGLWLNATTRAFATGIVPAGDAAWPVLVMQPGRERLVEIPRAAWDPGAIAFTVTGSLDAAGVADLQIAVAVDGVTASSLGEVRLREGAAQQSRFWTRLLTPHAIACMPASASPQVRDGAPADTVWTLAATSAGPLPASGLDLFLPRTLPPLMTPGELGSDRLTDLDLRALPRRHETWRIAMPAGWQLARADSVAVVDAAVAWNCQVWQEESELCLRRDVVWSEQVLPVAEVDRVANVLQKITALEAGFIEIRQEVSP